ncbi:MAG: hypothetical protein CSA58_09180 [Micrococcales bacterium]|nr:MAG: hypothetical protein CSB46_07965 [Micrococcales bacterium]PIE26499.1 MAG: hypothetical protein CSA58_09180 [Micrococcales bacterium]
MPLATSLVKPLPAFPGWLPAHRKRVDTRPRQTRRDVLVLRWHQEQHRHGGPWPAMPTSPLATAYRYLHEAIDVTTPGTPTWPG